MGRAAFAAYDAAPPAFGAGLRRFLKSKRASAVLPGFSWMKGGCLILADALEIWGAGDLRQGGALGRVRDRVYLDHAFAWIDYEGRRWLIDGDGIQDEPVMRLKLGSRDASRPVTFRYSPSARYAVGIGRDRARSEVLTTLLGQRFGPFSAALLKR